MEFPAWFRQIIQKRLDKVSSKVTYHPDLEQIRKEEEQAFQALFAGVDLKQSPGFSEWEDRHNLMLAMMNEKLYLRGMQDGIQLAVALLSPSIWQDEEEPLDR
ncbi:hypothetical protein [Paenibacillus brevis]|uniref:Uncharacterized protein n=1 Tax=Paenibacillus brevis TaxID=2841508 RepID=A0ABS6FPP7_9BACL|nr:hypothetical protein [Paenibacillus brevis]MBU5672158.1 hypothetical protein [Paenibacillus brevis]